MNRIFAFAIVVLVAAVVPPFFAAAPASAAPYTIKILSPATQAKVSTLGVRMTVQVGGGFILDQQNFGGANIAGHGHIHYFNDSFYIAATWLTTFTFTGLPKGPHILKAQLFNDDHTPVVPEVSDTVQVMAGDPSIKILEPTKDESVSSLGFRIRVAVSNFTMSALDFGGWNSSGEGHMHIFDVVGMTENYKDATAATTYTATGWSAGPHRIKVELYNNNHTELPNEYSDSVNVTVATPSIVLGTPIVEGQDVTLTWTVSGFVLDPGAFGGAPEPGRGHVHVFVDGSYKTATAGTSWTFTGLSAGTHTFKVELYNNDHTPLPTEYSSTVTVTAAPTEARFSPTVFYGSVGALVIVIVALAVLLVRKGRGGKPASPPPQG